MTRCPKKCLSDQLMPRVVLSSSQLSCSCSSVQVCTRDTCADSASCLLSSPRPGPQFCPHGMAPDDEDCTGPCHNPPAPPPPCPVCAKHLADAPSLELNTSKTYQPANQQPYNQPAQGPGYRNVQSPVQPMPYQTGSNPAYQPQTQPYNQPGLNPCCDAPFQPQTQPAQPLNQRGQIPACDTAFQSPPQPYNQPNQQDNQSTNTDGSYCSMSCGTLKKNPASNVDNEQPETENCCSNPEPKDDSLQPNDEKSSCCTSSSGIQTGPHIGPGKRIHSHSAISSSKRRPSLVHIQKGKELRLSLQEPLDKNSKKNDAGTQPHNQPTLPPGRENQSTNTSANGSYCSNSCGTLKRNSASNVGDDQPKYKNLSRWQGPEEKSNWFKSGRGVHTGSTNNIANGSCCSSSCGSLKKNSTTNVNNNQLKSKKSSNRSHEPEEKSSWYNSGRGIHAGSTNNSANGSCCSSSCGSLKKKSATKFNNDQPKSQNSRRYEPEERRSTHNSANGSQCSIRCVSLKKKSATNFNNDQPKYKNSRRRYEPVEKGSTHNSANGSQCSTRCGSLKKNSATNVNNDQPKSQNSRRYEPEERGSTHNSANGSQCSTRCGSLEKISATNVNNNQPKSQNSRIYEPEERDSTHNSANGSQCSIRYGTLKKNSAANVNNDQPKSENSRRRHKPEEKSSWDMSGRERSTNTSANGSCYSSSRGSLKKKSATDVNNDQLKSKKNFDKSGRGRHTPSNNFWFYSSP